MERTLDTGSIRECSWPTGSRFDAAGWRIIGRRQQNGTHKDRGHWRRKENTETLGARPRQTGDRVAVPDWLQP